MPGGPVLQLRGRVHPRPRRARGGRRSGARRMYMLGGSSSSTSSPSSCAIACASVSDRAVPSKCTYAKSIRFAKRVARCSSTMCGVRRPLASLKMTALTRLKCV